MVKSVSWQSAKKIGLSVAIGALALGAGTIMPAHSQAVPSKPISLSLSGAPVKQALTILFTGAHLNYTLDPNVAGYVNVNLRDVSFETALKAVLRSATPPLVADRDPDTGVYYVKPKTDTAAAAGNPGGQPGGFPQPAAQSFGPQPGQTFNPSPAPAPTTTSFNQQGAGGISLSQFETIQLRYADATILIKLLGEPSLIVPATSSQTGLGGTGGGGGGGASFAAPAASNTGTAGMTGNTSFGGR